LFHKFLSHAGDDASDYGYRFVVLAPEGDRRGGRADSDTHPVNAEVVTDYVIDTLDALPPNLVRIDHRSAANYN
jgi:hypothetical protein